MIEHGDSLRKKLVQGTDSLMNYVSCTLGPRGQNVIIKKQNERPFITKDGVTVAKHFSLVDPLENIAVEIIKQAAAKTNVDAGDGTTTSTVIACAIMKAAQDYIVEKGINPIHIKRSLDEVAQEVCEKIKLLAEPITSKEQISHIASISANNDRKIGELIATAVDKVGKDGSVTVEEARSLETTLELVEGFRFDSGYVAAAFVTDERRATARYEDPLFLITDSKLETVEQILPALEIAARESRPFVIVADDIEGQALAALIMNAIRGSMKVVAVKAPRYGEERRNIMSDLAISVGAKYFRRAAGDNLKEACLIDFGKAKTVEVSKNLTTIVGGNADFELVGGRITALREEVGQVVSLSAAERVQERITRLASGIAVVRVGGATEVEMIEKKHRVEDALEAVRSAQQEGILPGGGITLFKIVDSLCSSVDATPERHAAEEILRCAVREPFRLMAANAGSRFDVDAMITTLSVAELSLGYDFYAEKKVDLIESGIIDPAKVLRCSLQNAVSAAGTLITTNHAIIEV